MSSRAERSVVKDLGNTAQPLSSGCKQILREAQDDTIKELKDYSIKIRNFPESANDFVWIIYQKETKSDIKRQFGTIRDKSRHCG